MRWNPKSIMASALTAAMLVSMAVPAFGEEYQAVQAGAAQGVQTDLSQAPPLLITEVSTDQASGKRYTYTEVYNNSDAAINFSDYVFYYCYESGMGSGKVFDSSSWGSEGKDVYIQPGKTLVLWQSEGTKGRTVTDFNNFYGTELVENQDIVRIPYSGIHASAKRGYFFGKNEDSVVISAWSNEHGDEIAAGNPNKQAIQYTYPGTGRVCVDSGVAQATPGVVSEGQVPAERVHVAEKKPQISSVVGEGGSGLNVTAKIPYEGSALAMVVTLYYRQKTGAQFTEYQDFQKLDMVPSGDGETFTASVPADKIYSNEVQWYVKASYGPDMETETAEQNTAVEPSAANAAAPLYITEVAPNASGSDNGQYSYFEVYNQSDKAVNLGYYKILYYYDYPSKTASASGKVWSAGDYTTVLEPGKTMVYWLSSNGTTIDQFNAFYGSDLELGKDIIQVNYAGLHSSINRWIRFGTSESDAFTVAGFNITAGQLCQSGEALQFTYPHGESAEHASIPVKVSGATPGTTADWQIPSQSSPFPGYAGYPADDGQAPTLNVCPTENLPVPEAIQEGETLKVMYDVDLLMGATGADRLNAFKDHVDPENPQNHPGGSEALKNRPYLMGTEILYKLDQDSEWTSIKQKTQWRLGHFLMQIPADILFGHDQVSFKVRAYTLYGMSETEEHTVAINRLNDTEGGVRLNVQDGSVLSGIATLTANDGGDNTGTVIQVDGQSYAQQMLLEDGAYFMIQTQGMDNYFKNAVTAPYGDNARDIITILSPWCEQPLSRAIHVDNKYFNYNAETQTYDVTLTVWAGDSGTPFEEIYDVVLDANHEDFTVSGLQLKLANGKSYLPAEITPVNDKTNTDTALDAWHTIGDSAGMVPYLEASFQIPASEVNAVGYALDTTALTDGTHVVTAVSGENTAAANVIVDNTAPQIELNLAQDSVIYAPFLLEEDTLAQDENGVSTLAVSLDGQPLTLPAVITPHDLSVGEHVIAVAASDEAGNISTKEIRFMTEEVDPSVTDSNNDGITPTTANLTVSLGEETADVSFREGRSLTMENGGIVAAEGQGSQVSTQNGEAPYQIFTVNAGTVNESDNLAVNWSGSASNRDSTHPLCLYIYNVMSGSWDMAGTADENGNIQTSFGVQNYVADGQATLMVQCTTEGVAPDAAVPAALSEESLSDWDGTCRPENYDFALAWETDTQYYAESFPYHYDNMNQWIVDNAEEWKIRYVLHTGDIVDDVDMTGEWVNADHSMKIFDDAGMPYGVLGGNHDVYAGAEGYGNYWKYFGENRFQNKDYYGGSYNNNLGHYDLLTENGQDLLILYMSWDIYTEEIDWMNQVLAQYPERKAIIALHRYTNVGASDDLLDYTGKLLQDQVVAKNSNVIAVLNGHYHGASLQTDSFDDNGDGIKERVVYQICTDYQSDPEGGSEYIKFLYFDLANNKVYLNSYSPYRNDFNYYDTEKLNDYGDGTRAVAIDIAELDVAFDTAEKTLSTDYLKADIQTQNVIGEYQGVSGDVTHLWEQLTPQTQYGWYAQVTNAYLGKTTTAVQEFITEAVPEPVNYMLTATAGKGGTISNLGTTQVAEGGSLTYVVAPEGGYRVSQVLVDGLAAELTNSTYTFNQVTADHTIDVQFEQIPVEERADLTGLKAALEAAEAKNLEGYDEEVLGDLNQLMEQARKLLKDNNLTVSDQPAVDELAAGILKALTELPELPDKDSQDPGNQGGNSENPGNTNKPGGISKPGSTNKPGTSGSSYSDRIKNPNTGDTTNQLPYVIIGIAAAGCLGLILIAIRRKRCKK